jgi:hypothetical protein
LLRRVLRPCIGQRPWGWAADVEAAKPESMLPGCTRTPPVALARLCIVCRGCGRTRGRAKAAPERKAAPRALRCAALRCAVAAAATAAALVAAAAGRAYTDGKGHCHQLLGAKETARAGCLTAVLQPVRRGLEGCCTATVAEARVPTCCPLPFLVLVAARRLRSTCSTSLRRGDERRRGDGRRRGAGCSAATSRRSRLPAGPPFVRASLSWPQCEAS